MPVAYNGRLLEVDLSRGRTTVRRLEEGFLRRYIGGKGFAARILYDELGAGVGSRIAISEGREAAQPFYPDVKPIDAYDAAILDNVSVEALETDEEPT